MDVFIGHERDKQQEYVRNDHHLSNRGYNSLENLTAKEMRKRRSGQIREAKMAHLGMS